MFAPGWALGQDTKPPSPERPASSASSSPRPSGGRARSPSSTASRDATAKDAPRTVAPKGPGAQKEADAADPASAGKAAAAEKPPTAAPSPAPEGSGGKAAGFIRKNSAWILVVLGTLLAGVLGWAFLGSRERKSAEPFLEPLDSEIAAGRDASGAKKKFTSTRIRAEDVNARLGSAVAGTEVVTSGEYALVVDEEALKKPPPPGTVDARTGRTYVDDASIRRLIAEEKFETAYEEYLSRIGGSGEAEFQGDIEQHLSEHFLKTRDLEKAARILEHHVTTHAAEDIDPEVYFNLGYIHVLTKTINKSRRFLRLFVDSKAPPAHVERARQILQRLDTMTSLN
jgi:hypothetical protein